MIVQYTYREGKINSEEENIAYETRKERKRVFSLKKCVDKNSSKVIKLLVE